MRKGLVAAAAALLLLSQTGAALAGHPAVPLSATYQATIPASTGAATDVKVPVTLAYHWYDATGAVVVWDGLRSSIGAGGTLVAPGTSVTGTATVRAPDKVGAYTLRLALVKEGIAWFPPSQPFAVSVVAAYRASFTQPQVGPLIMGQSYVVPVTVQNAGAATWTATGATPVTLSSHWHDSAGNTVVWDGPRNALAADVAPGASVTVQARITAPVKAGTYTLTFDLVRETVAWFASLGSTP